MNRLLTSIMIMAALTAATACSTSKTNAVANRAGYVNAMPRAVIYRTNGDYADLVPVVLSADGSKLTWYPDVRDIRATSAPMDAGDGWLLDRIGVGEHTVYLDYTLDQYRSLGTTPPASELMRHIKPDARVTEVIVLDMTTPEAVEQLNKGAKLH